MGFFSNSKKQSPSPRRAHISKRQDDPSFARFLEEQEKSRQGIEMEQSPQPEQFEPKVEEFTPSELEEDVVEHIEILPDGRRRHHIRRRRPRKKKTQRKYLAFLLGFLIVLYLVLRFANIPFGTLTVNGHPNMIAELQANGTLSQHINILQIDKDELIEALENDLRYESATIHYQFPAGYVVEVKNRVPAAIVTTQMGYAILDKKAQCIGVENALNGEAIAMISGVKMGNVLLGDVLKEADVKAATDFLAIVNANGYVISEINIGNMQEIFGFTPDGIRVTLGNGEQMKEKAELAKKMIRDVHNSHERVKSITVDLVSPYVELAK